MKRIKLDRREGQMVLEVQTLDDLWTLHTFLTKGDLVAMDTYRTAEANTDKVREGKQEKKRMRLGLRVEDIEWHDFDDHLRIHGVIESGPQDHGRHHTHIVREGDRLDIHKPLQQWHLDLVDKAVNDSHAPQVILLAIDDSEAQFAVLRGHGLQYLGTLTAGGQGKAFAGAGKAKQQFYDEAAKSLETLRTGPDVGVIVVGPGWWREEFIDHVAKRGIKGILTDGTSQGGRAGVQEAMRRGVIEKVARDHRIHFETERMEELLARISKGSLCAYGPAEVEAAILAGAAEEVLVTDDAVRGNRFPGVLGAADATRATLHILATGHEAGAQLERLGGVAALLRYDV